MIPISGLEPSSNEFSWEAKNKEANFHIDDLSLNHQWYMIEIGLRTNINNGSLKFVFASKGNTSKKLLQIPFINGIIMKRLYRHNKHHKHILLYPVNLPSSFTITHCQFKPVPSFFAYHRMLLRIRNCLPLYKDLNILSIVYNITILAKRRNTSIFNHIFYIYNLTFTKNNYNKWIHTTETPENTLKYSIKKCRKYMNKDINIIFNLSIKNNNTSLLQKTIESIESQSCSNWKLCIFISSKVTKAITLLIKEHETNDSRIKSFNIDSISTPPSEQTGDEWIGSISQGDTLAVHALYFIIQTINNTPNAGLIYSDEDIIDKHGKRSYPKFKPEWNPDLFLSQNYIHKLCVINRKIYNRSGLSYNHAEDNYPEILACLPHLEETAIIHIPKILYHVHSPASAPPTSTLSQQIEETHIQALQNYLKKTGKPFLKVERGVLHQTYRIRYPLPKSPPLVSMLIPTRDMLNFLQPCVQSILEKTRYPCYEILIIDNGSIKVSTLEYLQHLEQSEKRVKILKYPQPFNYSAINNFAAQKADGQVLALINNDTEVINPHWLEEMVSHAIRPEIGCVGAKLYYSDKTIQHGGVILGLGGVAGHAHRHFPPASPGYCNRLQVIQNLSAVTAACLLVRKDIYFSVGGLEEDHLQVAFNDIDFCIKVRKAGYWNLWTPHARLFHHESKSRGIDDTPEKKNRFLKEFNYMQNKWGDFLKNDPNYSIHLSKNKEDFSIG